MVLPYVPREGEDEVKEVFTKTVALRGHGDQAREVRIATSSRRSSASTVRVKAATLLGLKPAGLDHGPVIPAAERAIERGSAEELVEVLCEVVKEKATWEQLRTVMHLKSEADGDVEANRKYVSAMLGLQVWAHKLYQCAESAPHEAHHSR